MTETYVHHDLDISGIVHAFPTKTGAGRLSLQKRLEEPCSDKEELVHRQSILRSIRARCKEPGVYEKVQDCLSILSAKETDVVSVAEASSDKRYSEYYNQILWPSDSKLSFFNEYNWFLELLVFLRTLFLPGMSVVLPLFVLLAPLVMYTLVLKKSISFSEYFVLLQNSIKTAIPSVVGKPRFAGNSNKMLESGEQIVQLCVGVGMFVAGIWNQIASAKAMRKVVADMRERANSIFLFTNAVQTLGTLLSIPVHSFQWPPTALGLFGTLWNSPSRIQPLLADAGMLDMLIAVALRKRICYPKYTQTFAIKDMYHPGLQRNVIYNSIAFEPRKHILLTGPNRGGKSTLLKAVGYAVLMSQTLGVVFARSASLPLFDSIITALTPADIVGSLSLFESEIEFAKSVKERISEAKGPVFLMMDEIFHGTNAHDGVEASQVFLDQLYTNFSSKSAAPVLYSIVSTHYMELPTHYEKEYTQNMCMKAEPNPNDTDTLIYSYELAPGMNRYSSVREIFRERGLLGKKTTSSGIKV
jgi:hypothetical protein